MKNRVEAFLEDMTYHSKFRVLEEARDNDKIREIAKKTGLKLPAHDLSVFECIYGFTDRKNKNGCTLPKEEVEKALDSLAHKAVDFDHLRKRVVGHWIHAELDGDKIIAYGTFYKGNFPEDFEEITDLMNKDVLAVSFEAWGDRKGSVDDYDLTDVEFAGGALLIRTEPAFDGAGVLELAKSKRVLELAHVMSPPKEFLHTSEKIKEERKKRGAEEGRLSVFDIDTIFNIIDDIDNLDGKTKGFFRILMIDFQNYKIKLHDLTTDGEIVVDISPRVSVTKKGKTTANISKITDLSGIKKIEDMDKFIDDYEQSDESLEILIEQSMEGPKVSHTERLDLTDEDFAIVKNIKTEAGNKKIRLLPITNLAHINAVQDRLGLSQVEATLTKLGIDKDSVEKKILRRANKLAMEKLLKRIEESSLGEVVQEIAKDTLKRELTVEELEEAYNIVTLTAPKGDANDTSLLKEVKKNSTANETSLINAEELTDDKVKEAITEATKKVEEAKTKEDKDKKDKEEADEKQKKLDEATSEAEKKVVELEDQLAKANKLIETFEKAEKDKKVAERKEALGEMAKDMSDEDLLDDTKFEMAKKDKKIAELEASSKNGNKGGSDLTKGSDDKGNLTDEQVSRDRVDQYAFGGRNAKEVKSE